MKNHETIFPCSIIDDTITNKYARDYLYLDAIKFIKDLKNTAPFEQSSPILFDISGCQSWSKVGSGLLKMYVGEILNKLHFIKNLKFGSLIKFG